MGSSKGPGIPAQLLPLLLVSAAAVAVQHAHATAPLGSYLGCFKLKRLGLRSEDLNRVRNYNKTSISRCPAACADQYYSLAIISSGYKCRCSINTPDEWARLSEEQCQQGGPGAAVFYLHKDADTTMCRLAEVPMTRDNWNIAYGDWNVNFDPVGTKKGTLNLRLEGTTGARLTPRDGDHLYGQYQARAKVSGEEGVVTAFYTRSSDVYPNAEAGDFSEIDWEWLNGNPAKNACSLWLHSYKDATSMGERLIGPDEYQKLLGWPSNKTSANSWVTYTFNWQPDLLVWAVDGLPVRTARNGQWQSWVGKGGSRVRRQFQSPNKPSHITISLWTDDRGRAPEKRFGGVLDPNSGPHFSYFKQLRRVLCDRPLPQGPAGVAARGPAWLYAGL